VALVKFTLITPLVLVPIIAPEGLLGFAVHVPPVGVPVRVTEPGAQSTTSAPADGGGKAAMVLVLLHIRASVTVTV
jgi:hypothetical protein